MWRGLQEKAEEKAATANMETDANKDDNEIEIEIEIELSESEETPSPTLLFPAQSLTSPVPKLRLDLLDDQSAPQPERAISARERLGWSQSPSQVRSPDKEQPKSAVEPSGDQQEVMCWCSAWLVSSEVLNAGG